MPEINNRLSNIEFIRTYAILSLVAWHSICVYVAWGNYLPDIEKVTGDTFTTQVYNIICKKVIMPSANMPLFTMVSGYVYAYLISLGKYNKTIEFIKKKIKRLIIPYFVLGLVVVYTIPDWSPFTIFTGEAHHLWFCAMLFWCFIIVRLYEKMPPPIKILLMLVCIGLQIFPIISDFDFLGVFKGVKFFPFFMFGYYLMSFIPKYQLLKGARIWAVTLWVVSLLVFIIAHHYDKQTILFVPVNYTYCFMLFALIPLNIEIGRFVKTICTYSFGIYVFHEWFLWNVAHIDSIHPFIINHQLLYPLIMYIFVLGVSILLTKYSLKTKLGRFLLGG